MYTLFLSFSHHSFPRRGCKYNCRPSRTENANQVQLHRCLQTVCQSVVVLLGLVEIIEKDRYFAIYHTDTAEVYFVESKLLYTLHKSEALTSLLFNTD